MNRLAGIIVAVVGVLILALGILKVVPLTSTGVCLLLLGALVIGLSFIRKPDPEGVERMSTASTLVNIFFSPGEVFANLRRHPRWLAAVLIGSILAAIYMTAFTRRVTPEVIVNYTIDKTLQMPFLNDEARAKIEAGRKEQIEAAKNPVVMAGQAVNRFVGQVFAAAFLAAIFLVFAMAMGGSLNYWQAFSATVYAFFPVAVLRWLLSLVFLYIKDPTDIHPIIGQNGIVQDNLNFLVNPADSPVLYVVLSSLSVLSLYWIIMNIIGLKTTGERVSSGIASTATISVWVLGLLLGVVFALLFPSFLS